MIISGLLLLLFVGMTVYFALTVPPMIPTLILAWIMLILQIKFECFN
jgi:hypothetical protein